VSSVMGDTLHAKVRRGEEFGASLAHVAGPALAAKWIVLLPLLPGIV
jgi:hypothetical protein